MSHVRGLKRKKKYGAWCKLFLRDGWSLFFSMTNTGFHVVVSQQGAGLMPFSNGVPYVPYTELNLLDALGDPGE